jgi:predicted TIM-barrel fold metal-dependent hydrolase
VQLPAEWQRKIYRDNALALYGLDG